MSQQLAALMTAGLTGFSSVLLTVIVVVSTQEIITMRAIFI
jgi:hypothetical protein